MNVLFAVLLGIVVLLILIYALIYVPMQQDRSFLEKLKRQREIQQVLDEVRDNTNIERALLLVCNNGRGIHRLDTKLKVSVLYQSYEPPFRSVIQEYQNLVVDGEYANMLQDVYDNDRVAYFVDQMPNGVLKTIYESEGVRWAAVYRVAEDKFHRKFYYMSLATSQEETPYQKGYEKQVMVTLNKIRSVHEYLDRSTWKRVREKLYI